MDLMFDRSFLKLGGTVTGRVDLHIPEGKLIARADAGSLVLEVSGADAGVSVETGDWPEPVTEKVGDGEIRVSRGSLSVPVTFTADADAVAGLRRLQFRVSYVTVGPESPAGASQVLALPAVLSVGNELAVASPWLFYVAGVCLALLLAVLVLRATRK
jgi:hypothetical protein